MNDRVKPEIRAEVERRLRQIEAECDVNIFFACESGSRAWGFESRNSDYDLRFLYAHPREWYVSIDVEHRRDVIEKPIVDELDINGWDIRKALKLLRKSNPPLLEWLQSPIVYRDRDGKADMLRALIDKSYSPRASMYHYLHMARGNHKDYLRGETVSYKKYFYVLRPLLAVKWIEADAQNQRGPVPMEFQRLLEDSIAPASGLRRDIDALLTRKRSGDELSAGPHIESISQFINSELSRLEHLDVSLRNNAVESAELDEVFRQIIGFSGGI